MRIYRTIRANGRTHWFHKTKSKSFEIEINCEHRIWLLNRLELMDKRVCELTIMGLIEEIIIYE